MGIDQCVQLFIAEPARGCRCAEQLDATVVIEQLERQTPRLVTRFGIRRHIQIGYPIIQRRFRLSAPLPQLGHLPQQLGTGRRLFQQVFADLPGRGRVACRQRHVESRLQGGHTVGLGPAPVLSQTGGQIKAHGALRRLYAAQPPIVAECFQAAAIEQLHRIFTGNRCLIGSQETVVSQQCKLPAPLNGTRLLGQLLIDHGSIGRLLRSQIPARGGQLMRLLVRPFNLRHRQMQICCACRQAKRQRQVGQLSLLCWAQAGQIELGKALTSSQNRLLVTAYRCHPAIEHQVVEAPGLLIAALPISQVLKRTRELAALDQHLYQF